MNASLPELNSPEALRYAADVLDNWGGPWMVTSSDELRAHAERLNPDPETLCTVCGNDTPTVRCCGQPFDYDRNM